MPTQCENFKIPASSWKFLKCLGNRVHSCSHEGTLLHGCGLGHGDVVNEEAHTALGDHIGHAVSTLDGDNRLGTTDAEEWEEVHNWVSAPRHDSGQAHLVQHAGNLRILSCSIAPFNPTSSFWTM